MSTSTEENAKTGMVLVHDYATSAMRIVNLGYVTSIDQDERTNPQDKTDLKMYECANIQLFGSERMLVRETVEQIVDAIGDEGARVFEGARYGPHDPAPLVPRREKAVVG